MRRRTLLKSLVTTFLAGPMARMRLYGRAQDLSAPQLAALGAIAEVVLPSAVGADGRDLVVERFATWVREYREGADMGHVYGFATLRRRSGPSPARNYPAQFDALDAAARERGGTTFAALPVDARRLVIEGVLNEPQRVTRLPSQPNGANLIADFMGLYYSSPEAWDLAYERRIGRDRCRSLDGSEERPAPLETGSGLPAAPIALNEGGPEGRPSRPVGNAARAWR